MLLLLLLRSWKWVALGGQWVVLVVWCWDVIHPAPPALALRPVKFLIDCCQMAECLSTDCKCKDCNCICQPEVK